MASKKQHKVIMGDEVNFTTWSGVHVIGHVIKVFNDDDQHVTLKVHMQSGIKQIHHKIPIKPEIKEPNKAFYTIRKAPTSKNSDNGDNSSQNSFSSQSQSIL